jgi:hypothetical protein
MARVLIKSNFHRYLHTDLRESERKAKSDLIANLLISGLLSLAFGGYRPQTISILAQPWSDYAGNGIYYRAMITSM